MTMTKKKIVTLEEANNLFNKAVIIKGGTVIQLLQKSDYQGCPIYIRMIDSKIFEYILQYKGEIYTGYNVITPEKGKKKLNKDQIAQCGALIFTGAITTIENLIEIEQEKMLAKDSKKTVN